MPAIRPPAKSPLQGLVILPGSFATNGSSSPAAASNLGTGFTVARTGTGVYTVTLSDRYTSAVAILTSRHGAIDDVKASTYTASTRVFTITTLVSGSAADVAANAANRVSFVLYLQGAISG